MRHSLGLVLLTSVAFALATASNSAHVVKQTVVPPNGWSKHGVPSPDSRIELRIGLSQPNVHILEEHLLQTSDPDHERYGQHLSKQQVEALVAPQEDSLALVDNWLRLAGIDQADVSRSAARDWTIVNVPIGVAETMLNTTYHLWKHIDGEYLVRTTSYSVPEHLSEHIDVIQPTTMFARFKAMKSTLFWPNGKTLDSTIDTVNGLAPVANVASGALIDANCNTTITLPCLQELYKTAGYKPLAAKHNSIAITGYLEQYANFDDLQLFYADQRQDALNSSFKFVSVAGGLNNQSSAAAGVEANLDVQYAFGLSFPTPATFYSTAGRPPFTPDLGTTTNTNEPYAVWLDYVLSHGDLPNVVSTSYGDHEQTVPEDYARRTCLRFLELGARGVSLTFSSGDGGVGDGNSDPTTQTCLTNDGRNLTRFIPLFPSTCPYVTSVGGTRGVPEKAVFFSGGGFSNYVGFSRPLYQESAVSAFLDRIPKDLYKGLFNASGRAIPDVAAQGLDYRVWISGAPHLVSGTSASSPTFAGIVALLNDARLHAGLPSLGFLNPLLYKKGVAGLNDITSGNNPGCGTPGFNATEGWDPVTGLGTPNFQKLKDVVLLY